MLLWQLTKHLNVWLPLCTHWILTYFYVLTSLKTFFVGQYLNTSKHSGKIVYIYIFKWAAAFSKLKDMY